MSENRVEVAVCSVCEKLIVGTEIVNYRIDFTWRKWCWPCFKANHLRNLTRLQEEK